MLLTVGFWISASVTSFAQDDDLKALDQQLYKLFEKGNFKAGIPIAERRVEVLKRVRGPEHRDTVAALNTLSRLYAKVGDYAHAEAVLQEVLSICKKVLGAEHPDTAQRLDDLGVLYYITHEYANAEPLFQEALRIRQKVLGPDDPNTATSLNNLAELYYTMGENVKAEPLYQEALRIRQKVLGPDDPNTATSLNHLAELYQAMGRYTEAVPLVEDALRIWEKMLGPKHPIVAQSLNNVAELYWAMGRYADAEPLYLRALGIRREVLGPEHPDTAQSLNSVAWLYRVMGEHTKAEQFYQEALRIRRKVLGPEHPDTAVSCFDLAALYGEMGENDKAEPLYQEALRIYEKVLGPKHPTVAHCFNNLAELYEDIGEYAKAESFYQDALRVYRESVGPDHPDTATCLFNLGVLLYQKMGEYDKAEPLLQEALRIRQKALGPEHIQTALSLERLAYLEFDLGRIDEATRLARQESTVKLKVLPKVFSFASEQQRLWLLDNFRPYSLFPFLMGTENDLAAAVLCYKGIVLDSIIEDRQLAEASKGQYQGLVRQLTLDKRQLGQLLLQPAQKSTAGANQRIEALEGNIEKIEGQLAEHVASLGRAQRALDVRPEQVQSTIPDDGALVEYVRYWHYLGKNRGEWRYGAVVLFPNGAPSWIPLGPADKIEELVRQYGILVRGSPEEDELAANLQAVYEALWAPIRRTLPSQIKRLIISPDGQLNFISFATLLSEDNELLAEKYEVQYVASGRDLLHQAKPSTVKDVILFTDPNFSAPTGTPAQADHSAVDAGSIQASEKGDIEGWSFEDLRGTQQERDVLIREFTRWGWRLSNGTEKGAKQKAVLNFTRERATKETLLKVRSPYILHLATHGFFAKEDPTTTQTEGGAKVRQGVTRSKFFDNPMHRSGLALAGAQTTVEAWKHEEVPPVENDGILTAEDVSTLNLQGTWLVTLSACDTGSGEAHAGEGVLGLRRGFVEAGAQNLLMTLWPISDDEVTVQIISDFYEAAHKSDNAPASLAEVQRNWLTKLRSANALARAVSLAGPFIMSSQGNP